MTRKNSCLMTPYRKSWSLWLVALIVVFGLSLPANAQGKSGSGGCTTLGTPSAFTLVTTLNYAKPSGAPQYQPHLGTVMSVRPVTLSNGSQSSTVLIAAVGSGNGSGRMEFFFLDPTSGKVLDGSVIVGTQVQPHITVQYDPTATIWARSIAAGDVNADGIPDFVIGNFFYNAGIVFLSKMDANGILSYSFVSLNPPASNPGKFGNSVAMGMLDGISAGDDVVVGAIGAGGKKGTEGAVYVYQFNGSGFDSPQTVADPLHMPGDQFGASVAVGDVTSDGVPDLIVGAPAATVGSASLAGAIFVFPSPLSSTTNHMLTTGIAGNLLGSQVSTGMLSSSTATDVIASNSYNASSNPRVMVFEGPITGNLAASTFDFLPYPGLTSGWATSMDAGDMTGDGRVEVLVGAPNATNSTSCTNVGAADLYLSNPTNPSQPTLIIFQPPTLVGDGLFGFGVAIAPALPGSVPLLLVGANIDNVGSVTGAGQVFVYKKN